MYTFIGVLVVVWILGVLGTWAILATFGEKPEADAVGGIMTMWAAGVLLGAVYVMAAVYTPAPLPGKTLYTYHSGELVAHEKGVWHQEDTGQVFYADMEPVELSRNCVGLGGVVLSKSPALRLDGVNLTVQILEPSLLYDREEARVHGIYAYEDDLDQEIARLQRAMLPQLLQGQGDASQGDYYATLVAELDRFTRRYGFTVLGVEDPRTACKKH